MKAEAGLFSSYDALGDDCNDGVCHVSWGFVCGLCRRGRSHEADLIVHQCIQGENSEPHFSMASWQFSIATSVSGFELFPLGGAERGGEMKYEGELGQRQV